MTEAAQQESPEPPRELDRKLLAEANLYGVAYKPYAAMTSRERGAVKGRWAHKIRSEAKRRGIDPDEFLAMSEDAREEVRKEYPERPPAPKPPQKKRSIEDVAAKRVAAEYVDEGLTRGDETYSPESLVPPTESDPRLRDKPTLGEVTPADNEDLVGWTPPSNLLDIYARFTIGDGQHFIRVERLEPKIWQSVPCAGYLGEIREPISEEQFRAFYGGRVYSLTVYGPDPHGRRDPTNDTPIIKAKTQPFRYTVANMPYPNFKALPGVSPSAHGVNPMQPFPVGMFPSGEMPTTPAAAQQFKSTLDFVSDMVERGDKKAEEARRNNGQTSDVLKVVSDAGREAIEQANKAAATREKALLDQLASEREDRKKLEDKIDKLAAAPKTSSVQEATELLKTLNPAENAQQQVVRLEQQHKDEISRIREQHKETLDALRIRHDDEVKRLRDRIDDIERMYKSKLEDAEKRLLERDRELRLDIDRERKDGQDRVRETEARERSVAAERIKETEKLFEGRLADLRSQNERELRDAKSQNERELRMQKEQFDTRVETSKSTMDMQLAAAKERVKRLEEEIEEAKEELAAAKDPIAIMERAKKEAEALGFEKKEDAGPQTTGERFAATVGLGLSKALETIPEWGPKMMASFGQRSQPALGSVPVQRLPQGQQGPGQRPPQQRVASRRTVAWATQGSVPIAGQEPVIPPERPSAPQAAPPVTAPQAPPPAAAPPPPATSIPESAAAPAPAPAAPPGPATNPMGLIFPDDVVVEFRMRVEQAINANYSAETFADQFRGQFPDAAVALASTYKPEHLAEVVKGMPNSGDSPILRRDGKRWVEKFWARLSAPAGAPAPS